MMENAETKMQMVFPMVTTKEGYCVRVQDNNDK